MSSSSATSDKTSEKGTAETGGTTTSGSNSGSSKNKSAGLKISLSPTPASTASARKTPVSGSMTPTGTGGMSQQDQHPYARGAVIEVWHIPPNTDKSNHQSAAGVTSSSSSATWWSEPDSSDDEETAQKDPENEETTNQSNNNNNYTGATIRLCDIIDRAPINTTTTSADNNNLIPWRYYIHYRDFNRRMDEWIDAGRIVSPPSVGNAKARALKRQAEAAQKKRLRQEQEEQAAAEAAAYADTPRQRRRTAASTPAPPSDSHPEASSSAATSLADATAGGLDESGAGRRRRLSRRKSSLQQLDDDDMVAMTAEDDNATVTASNMGPDTGDDATATATKAGAASSAAAAASSHAHAGGTSHPKHHHHHKDVLVPVGESVTTHTVGEHVVATLQAQELDEHEGLDEASLREHEEVTKVKNVALLELGYYQMETWYFSPLPRELVGPSGFLDVLYVCEFTLSLFARKSELLRSQDRIATKDRHPPGNEIYRSGNLAMFEVDGQEEKIYSQNLCYIAKLFLDHKTLYFDVDPFLFYVLCEVDERGYHPVGYFSKEKYSDVGYNLACILTFPAHQRKGYGRFLIAFSYELSKKEEKVGSPEKPMSDLGQQAYKPYWASTIIDFLLHQSADESSLSVMDISKRTSIMAEDIVFTLNQLGLLKMMNDVYFIAAEENLLRRLAQKYPIKKPFIDPSALHWTPFLTDVKRDKFSIHSKKTSVADDSLLRATPVPPSTASKASSS